MDSTPLMSWFQRVRRTGSSAGGGGSSSSKSSGEVEKVAGLRALLTKARLERKLGVAEAWCEEEGVVSIPYLRFAEGEAEFVDALKLTKMQARVLTKLLEKVPADAPPSERQSTGEIAVSAKL